MKSLIISVVVGLAFLAFLWSIVSKIRVPYAREILEASARWGIPPHLAFAQVKKESNFNPRAVGTVGEIGLMQIRQGALTDVNIKLGTHYTLSDLYIPRTNLIVGFAYLDSLRDRYGNLTQAYSAYNTGSPTSTRGHSYALSIHEIAKQY
jgi:soluble lytic murein transglycosylase-like protein